MNTKPQINYPIDKNLSDKLGGILIPGAFQVGSFISIMGSSYRIYGVYKVRCTLFVSTGAISISYENYRISGTGKVKRFLAHIGLRNHAEFAANFFNNCQIIDTIAVKDYYFHSFSDENIFKTWQ